MTLDEHMRANGITDEALANQLDVSRPYVTRLRNGERKPSLDVAVRIERATGIPASSWAEPAPEAAQ